MNEDRKQSEEEAVLECWGGAVWSEFRKEYCRRKSRARVVVHSTRFPVWSGGGLEHKKRRHKKYGGGGEGWPKKSRVQVKINHCLQVSSSLTKDENRTSQIPYRKKSRGDNVCFDTSCCNAQFCAVRLFTGPMDTANGIESADSNNRDIQKILPFFSWSFLVKRVAF